MHIMHPVYILTVLFFPSSNHQLATFRIWPYTWIPFHFFRRTSITSFVRESVSLLKCSAGIVWPKRRRNGRRDLSSVDSNIYYLFTSSIIGLDLQKKPPAIQWIFCVEMMNFFSRYLWLVLFFLHLPSITSFATTPETRNDAIASSRGGEIWVPPSQNKAQKRGTIFTIRNEEDLLDFIIEDDRLCVGE